VPLNSSNGGVATGIRINILYCRDHFLGNQVSLRAAGNTVPIQNAVCLSVRETRGAGDEVYLGYMPESLREAASPSGTGGGQRFNKSSVILLAVGDFQLPTNCRVRAIWGRYVNNAYQ
jgi:hypothetical protein